MRLGPALAAALLAATLAVPAHASTPDLPARLERVSVGLGGTQPNGHSQNPVISDDGRFVAYESEADNLVPDDTNGTFDIFVYDRVTGVTEMVSVAGDGTYANDISANPAISADGRYVSFTSLASNLVPGDTNDTFDIFVRDRVAGTTERVSVGPDAEQSNRTSSSSSLSADGSRVAFTSAASNLVTGDDNGFSDVFVHDRTSHTTVMASANADGEPSNLLGAAAGDISPDGDFVAFRSMGLNYGPPGSDFTADYDVYLKSLRTGQVERISVATDGTPAQDLSACPAVSANADAVVFASRAGNLVPADFNGLEDYFVRDRVAGTTERINVTAEAAESVGVSVYMCPITITADGRFVAFEAVAGDLVVDDRNNNLDVFVHDRLTGGLERISLGNGGAESRGSSHNPDMTGDGRYVVFQGQGDDLVPGDTNEEGDIFVYDRGPRLGVGAMTVDVAGDAVTASGWTNFDGAMLAQGSAPADARLRGTGADLVGAALAHRPDRGELSITWRLAGLPHVPGTSMPTSGQPLTRGVAGAPGVVYGVRLTVGDRVIVLAGGRSPESPLVGFGAYECAMTCTAVADAAGSVGVTGVEARAVVDLDALNLAGQPITDVQAFTAAGTQTVPTAPSAWLDRVALGPVAVPAPALSLGAAPAEVPAERVTFAGVDLAAGLFSATMASGTPGEWRLWARACYAGTCADHSRPYVVD